jgi:hypothetical protein
MEPYFKLSPYKDHKQSVCCDQSYTLFKDIYIFKNSRNLP